MCRWETVIETDASEKIENKSPNGQSSAQRSIKMVSRKSQRTQVNIMDFNLLRIPPKIDINFIIQEIIVPRLPDGYTIAMSEPRSRPNSTQPFSIEAKTSKKDKTQIESTKDFLIATNSPRQLHPKRTLKFDVKISERKPIEQNSGEREYLFSQLLQDLDDLCDKQQPLIEKQMDDISENLSVSMPDEGSDQQDAEPEETLFKSEEFTWNITRRETVPEIIEPVEEEESDEEFEESDSDELVFECFTLEFSFENFSN